MQTNTNLFSVHFRTSHYFPFFSHSIIFSVFARSRCPASDSGHYFIPMYLYSYSFQSWYFSFLFRYFLLNTLKQFLNCTNLSNFLHTHRLFFSPSLLIFFRVVLDNITLCSLMAVQLYLSRNLVAKEYLPAFIKAS